jgi:hypothetical protein
VELSQETMTSTVTTPVKVLTADLWQRFQQELEFELEREARPHGSGGCTGSAALCRAAEPVRNVAAQQLPAGVRAVPDRVEPDVGAERRAEES